MLNQRPYAPACDKNKEPILEVLRQEFLHSGLVLEIGSGTGQHAVYFAKHLRHLEWQPTDLSENLPGINAWCSNSELANLRHPQKLNVRTANWTGLKADYLFSANAVHIMDWASVENFFSGIGECLAPGGKAAFYGPFNFAGQYTSESNARFDQWLKERDFLSGIRNFEDLDRLARSVGLSFLKDYPLPANNRTLIWSRR